MSDKLAHPKRPGRSFVSDSIVLKPGETKRLPLGAYNTAEQSPQFDQTIEPNIGEQLGLSHEKMEIPGSSRYILFYELHNFSNMACTVTVRRRGAAAAA